MPGQRKKSTKKDSHMQPVWKTDSLFPPLGTPEFKHVMEDFSSQIAAFGEKLARVQGGTRDPQTVLALIPPMETLMDLHESLESFTYMGFSVNTAAPETGAALDDLELRSLPLKALESKLLKLIAGTSYTDEQIQGVLGDERYKVIIAEAKVEAQHLMSEAEEELVNDLMRSGGSAWSKLHSSLSSSLSTTWDENQGGKAHTSEKTLVELRQLASHEDRAVRKKAYEKELALWETHEIAFAAALNGVKGQALTVEARRHWPSNLHKSLFQSRFSPKALESMIAAMEDSLGDFRRYFSAKAKVLGLEKLGFYDLFAPIPGASREWAYPEATAFITEQFEEFSPRMGDFARKAFGGNWVHVPLQKGKVGGAYCTYLPTAGESRLLVNYLGSFNDIRTLAHELGHAYHFEILHPLPAQLRVLPMPLAETASIFSETLIFEKALEKATKDEALALLDSHLLDAAQVIVDILSRFSFESRVFAIRRERELTPKEFCQLMLEAQEKTYGEALDPEARHPYMWAVKGHYYSPDLGFYNYPYAFGLLFALGIFAKAQDSPETFPQTYDGILEKTGWLSAVAIAKDLGYNLEDKGFWESSLGVLRKQIDTFVAHVEERHES
jgi:oligoendopeptidase F